MQKPSIPCKYGQRTLNEDDDDYECSIVISKVHSCNATLAKLSAYTNSLNNSQCCTREYEVRQPSAS